jgi:uncharacterized OB-fold protein
MSASPVSEGVTIWRCVQCGLGAFPQPLLCARCHNPEFTADRVDDAVVEEVSVIRHMLGHENWQPRRIASVRTAEGLLMTVGLVDESGPGATIELYQEGEAPFGRTKKAGKPS